jgi:filamentous hemagglutinin
MKPPCPPARTRTVYAVRAAVRIWLTAFVPLCPQSAFADALPDPLAPAHQQAGMEFAGTTPVVRITRPDSAGISHNKWTAFDVPVQGMVLNNATAPATSALAGSLGTNTNLNGTAARLILNEVTGNRPSALLGMIEVGGHAARVVIANPNGITCDGCGFVNTSHVQLTTGRPDRLADVLRFDVTQGQIDIGASGLAALATRLDLIAHTLRSTGPVTTQSGLSVIAARAIVDADSLAMSDTGRPSGGPYPQQSPGVFAIDIGQSVAAASIQLIAIGDELGVRATAPLLAVEDIVIATRETLDLRGDLFAARDVALFNSGSLQSTVSGAIDAGRHVRFIATGLTLRDAGRITAGSNIEFGFFGDNSDGWSGFLNEGLVDAVGDVVFAGPIGGVNHGVIRAGRMLQAAAGVVLSESGNPLPGSHPARAVDADVVALANTGVLRAGEDLYLNLIGNDGGLVSAGQDAFIWQSQRGHYSDVYPLPVAAAGEITAGRDLYLFAAVDQGELPVSPNVMPSVMSFGAARDLHLVDAPDLLWAGGDLREVLRDGLQVLPGVTTLPYVNGDTLEAGNDVRIAITAGFRNESIIDAQRDLRIVARGVTNETRIDTRQATFAHERFDGCRTEYHGTCSASIETSAASALIAVGRDLIADTPSFRNIGASILVGRHIDIETVDFLNRDRIHRADWTSTYYAIDLDAQLGGVPCSQDCLQPIDWLRTTSGSVVLGTLPGVIQAGGLLSVVAVRSEVRSPDDPGVTPGGPPGASAALSTFVNTGNIHADRIVVRADDIRNGFDFVSDYYHRTADLKLPPASIDVIGFGTSGTRALHAGDYSGAALMDLLPPGLASNRPFALTPAEEEAALRNALVTTTHRGWILPGLAWDPLTGQSPQQQQHAILAANGAAFAIEHQVAMGAALTDEQQSMLSAPMLWYVERAGRLYPQVHLPAEWRDQLAVVPGGELDADVAIVLASRHVDNTGFVVSDGALSITADTLRNRKRSAYYYEERKVSGGTLIIEGDTVQHGGFMQAAAWDIDVGAIDSVSGEFRVLGESAARTAEFSRAFEAELAAELGDRFTYRAARDDLHFRFRQRTGFGDLVGIVAGMAASMLIGPQVSQLIGSLATGYGSTWASASLTASAGLGNVIGSAAVTQMLSSSIGQFVATGRIDVGAAVHSGLAGAITAGTGSWANMNVDDALQRFSIRALTTGAVGELTGTGFGNALFNAISNEASALGANEIGQGNFGPQGSLGHTLAHGVLGALTAAARGQDAYSGALGAITATFVEQPLDSALALQGTDREIALTALSMLAGGAVTDLAGGDAVTAGWAAQNATVNNYLTHSQDLMRRARLADADSDDARAAIESEYATLDTAQKELAQKCLVGGQCPTVIDRMGYQNALEDLIAACEAPRLCTDEMRRSKDELFSLHSIAENSIAPLYVLEDFLLFGSTLPVIGSAFSQVAKLRSTAAFPLLGALAPRRAAITNSVPSELARVIPGRGNFPTLGPPSRIDVFVTAADDIAGLNSLELARKLTIPESNIFTVVRFQTPRSGLASPVNRTDPGFVGGGRTTGGAREFVIPNSKIPADARIEVIVP